MISVVFIWFISVCYLFITRFKCLGGAKKKFSNKIDIRNRKLSSTYFSHPVSSLNSVFCLDYFWQCIGNRHCRFCNRDPLLRVMHQCFERHVYQETEKSGHHSEWIQRSRNSRHLSCMIMWRYHVVGIDQWERIKSPANHHHTLLF